MIYIININIFNIFWLKLKNFSKRKSDTHLYYNGSIKIILDPLRKNVPRWESLTIMHSEKYIQQIVPIKIKHPSHTSNPIRWPMLCVLWQASHASSCVWSLTPPPAPIPPAPAHWQEFDLWLVLFFFPEKMWRGPWCLRGGVELGNLKI